MHPRLVILPALWLAGCSKEEAAPSPPRDPNLASLFTGSAVTLPAEVAKATFDAKRAEVAAALGVELEPHVDRVRSKTHDVAYHLSFSRDDNLQRISLSAPGSAALVAILTEQWGPPTTLAEGRLHWSNPATGLRASIAPKHSPFLELYPYETIPTLLGPRGFDLAFAKDKKLFGATVDELRAAWGGRLCDLEKEAWHVESVADDPVERVRAGQISLCRTATRSTEERPGLPDTILIGRDGKAFAVRLVFPTDADTTFEQIVEQLDAKFGAAEVVSETHRTHRYYLDAAAKQRAVMARDDRFAEPVEVTIGPYLPLAALIGDARQPGLGIETPSMLGGSLAQVVEENRATYHHRGSAHELSLPSIEHAYAGHHTTVSLRLSADGLRVDGYDVVIRTGAANHDAVLDAVKAKYGAPASTKEDPDAYGRTVSFRKHGRKLDVGIKTGLVLLKMRK